MIAVAKWLYVAVTAYFHKLRPVSHDYPALAARENGTNGSVASPITLTVEESGGNQSSPLLYGVMFEVSAARQHGIVLVTFS